MKTIGIVCEGDRDYDMLSNVVSNFMNEDYLFTSLQPNQEFGKQFGNGWKGVWRWCETYGISLNKYLNGITPRIDLLIIQMDADVARCEKEAYCTTIEIGCPGQHREHPLNCSISKDRNQGCRQSIPPNSACDGSVNGRVNYLTHILSEYIEADSKDVTVITIPCDSTDAWILAAFEESISDIETVSSPWEIISHKKMYHGIRIPGHDKRRRPYGQLIEQVCKNWNTVRNHCPQSRLFEDQVREKLQVFDNDMENAT